jgi:hypothetical protein
MKRIGIAHDPYLVTHVQVSYGLNATLDRGENALPCRPEKGARHVDSTGIFGDYTEEIGRRHQPSIQPVLEVTLAVPRPYRVQLPITRYRPAERFKIDRYDDVANVKQNNAHILFSRIITPSIKQFQFGTQMASMIPDVSCHSGSDEVRRRIHTTPDPSRCYTSVRMTRPDAGFFAKSKLQM